MSELDLERLLMAIAANDRTNAELAAEFNRAPSTIYNIKVKHRDRIDDLRRKMSVQFEDLFMTRKQARLHDIQHLRDIAWGQLQALLASNCVIDGRTGEVRAGPVDERKFKVFVELIIKANRNFAEECGQLPQRVEGLDQRFTLPVLGLGSGSIDYAAAAQRRREREATAPQRAAEEQERREAARERTDAFVRQLMAAYGPPEPDPELDEDTEPRPSSMGDRPTTRTRNRSRTWTGHHARDSPTNPNSHPSSGVFSQRSSVGSSTVCLPSLRGPDRWSKPRGRSMPGARLANSGGHDASSLECRGLNSDVDCDGRRRRGRPGSSRRIVQQG
jgi:hypothetical protein